MDVIEEYVQSLDDTTRRQIMLDYDFYEKNTMIGDSVLRTNVEILMKDNGARINTRLWIEMLASAVFRYYARKYWQD